MMEAHIIYIDSFIIGVEHILNSIQKSYGCMKIDINDVYRKESIKGTSLVQEIQSFLQKKELVPDSLYHELLIKNIDNLSGNILIQNYPTTKGQWELLKVAFDHAGFTIGKIWYLEALNVLNNIQKVEKYKIQAERHDPTLSHIKKQHIRSKLANLKQIEFIDDWENLQIIGVESFGIGGREYFNNLLSKYNF